MAIIKPYFDKKLRDAQTITWFDVADGDDCLPFEYSKYSDKSFHIFGDFGGGSITIQGSNKVDAQEEPSNGEWVTLTDFTNSPLVVTELTLKLIAQNPRFIRVVPSGVTKVTVAVECNGD